jgi:hypothetical protein
MMLRRTLAILGGLALIVAADTSLSTQPSCQIADLSWMAGDWHNAADPTRAQERWTLAPEGVLMGSSWEFPAGKSGYAEIMTIRPDGESISMFLRHFDGGLKGAWEERGAPMVFQVSSCGRNAANFEGRGEHAGERMSYRRSGDKLLIAADFQHHGTPNHEEWRMIRAGN